MRRSDAVVVCLVLSEGRGPTLQSSRSLDALSDLKLQRLEAELEGARHQAEGACQREKELRAELQRLQQEVAQLQEVQRQVDLMLKMKSLSHYLHSRPPNLMYRVGLDRFLSDREKKELVIINLQFIRCHPIIKS